MLDAARKRQDAISVGLVGNCADVLPELIKRGVTPDIVTDQTSAHDPLNGDVPNHMSLDEALLLRKRDPKEYVRRSMDTMARHMEAILALQAAGSVAFDYGNNLRAHAQERRSRARI